MTSTPPVRDRETQLPPTEKERGVLPSFVSNALSWFSFFTTASLDRHLEIIGNIPDLPPLEGTPPSEAQQLPPETLALVETTIERLSTVIAKAASTSSPVKGFQITEAEAAAKGAVQQQVTNVLKQLLENVTEQDTKQLDPAVQKLASAFARTLIKQSVSGADTSSPQIEALIHQLVKPLLNGIFKQLVEMDESGKIRGFIDRLIIHLDQHVTAIGAAPTSVHDFQATEGQGCHPVIRIMTYAGMETPNFKEHLRGHNLDLLNTLISTFFTKEQREVYFKELYKTKKNWIPLLVPSFVDKAIFTTLITDEAKFVAVAEYAFTFFLQKNQESILDAMGKNLVEFSDPEKIRGFIYQTLFPQIAAFLEQKIAMQGLIDVHLDDELAYPVDRNPPEAFGHLVNQLLFGVLLQAGNFGVLGKLWEKPVSKTVAGLLSFVRDDPLPLIKLLILAQPILQAAPSPPSPITTNEEALRKVASLLRELAAANVPSYLSSLLPSEQTIVELIRSRVNTLTDSRWKNLNLFLHLLDAIV